MALYGTRYGLPQSVVDYLNQALPNIDQSPYVDESPAVDPVNILSNDESSNSDAISQLISNEYVAGGGGGDFGVYNPDPNMTRGEDNYNERPYKSALYNNAFPMMGDPMANQATGALNADGLMSYPGDKPPTGIEKLIGMLPGQKVLKGIKNMLPVNRTGILQNELLGAGFQLNDIGQIVGDPRTVEGVMAGLNSSRMDAGSFDKKSAGIESTLSGKYGLSKSEIDSIKAGNITDAIKDKTFNKTMGTTTNLVQDLLNTQIAKDKFNKAIDKTTAVFDAQSLAKDPNYQSFSDITKQGLEEGEEDTDEQENFEEQLLNQIFSKIDQKQETEIKDNKELLDKIEKEQKQKEALAATEDNKDNKDGKNDYTGPPTTKYNKDVEVTGPNYGPYSQSPTNFGGGDGPGDGSQQGANEAQNEANQESAGAGGYRKGGRVTFLNGGLADLIYLLSLR